jgi:HEAT repeat protein
MGKNWSLRSWSSCLAGIVLSLCCFSPCALTQELGTDPVEELREALRLEDASSPNDFMLDFRRTNLDAKIKALKTIGELRRALALEEWKEEPGQGRSEALRLIDEQKRKEVGQKLQQAIRSVVDKGPPNAKLAVANMIAETGPSIRALELADRTGFARSLTPEIIKLVQDTDLAVRQEALRALGTINPDPDKAIPVFKSVLQKDTKEANQLRKPGQASKRVEASEKDFMRLAIEIVPLARLGLKDADPRARAASLEAMQIASQGLVDLIYEPYSKQNFPPEGRLLVEAEVRDILATYEKVREELDTLKPLGKVFQENAPSLIPALADEHATVRFAAINTLESLAWARLKQKRRLESVPLPSTARGKVAPLQMEDPLALFLKNGLPAVVGLLKDPEVRIRRITVDFLENLGDTAIPAIPALAESLHDADRFVRWAAARTLASLPPTKTQVALPALARLINDSDLNVRQAAAGALESMGALAAPAIQSLTQALTDGDVESRTLVMGVLTRLPPEQSRLAVPQLIENLAHNDPRLRKAAAETLAKLGPLAQPAVPSLRRMLGDDEAEVRQAASDAILSILVTP